MLGKQMYVKKSMKDICSLLGKTRQALYDSLQRKEERQMEEVLVLTLVKEERARQKNLGCEKVHLRIKEQLAAHHIKIGRDKMYQLLADHGMLIRQGTFKPRTTNSDHPYKKYKNLVRELEVDRPCQLWASDITYLSTVHGFIYLSLITDCYSHKIVGWCLHPDLSSKGPVNALNMAFSTNLEHLGLIHHSDRGVQYCCTDYVKALTANNVGISMTENGDPYENAIAERVNGILKYEYDLNTVFTDYYQALESVKTAVELYNTARPHMSCNMLTPEQAHNGSGPLKKHWKPKNKPQVAIDGAE
jgi:putative transposase